MFGFELISLLGLFGAFLSVVKLVPQIVVTLQRGNATGLSPASLALGLVSSLFLSLHILLGSSNYELDAAFLFMLGLNGSNFGFALILFLIVTRYNSRRYKHKIMIENLNKCIKLSNKNRPKISLIVDRLPVTAKARVLKTKKVGLALNKKDVEIFKKFGLDLTETKPSRNQRKSRRPKKGQR